MTVSDLIDYLQQFEGDETVVLNDDDFQGDGDYVSLAGLDYSDQEQQAEEV